MSKRVTNEEISAWYDGEPLGSRADHVAYRMREDQSLRSQANQYAALSQHFRALPEPAVRPNFAGDVIREIEARSEQRTRSWWSGLMAPLATAAALVAFAGFAVISVMDANVPVTQTIATAVEDAPAEKLTLAALLHDTYSGESADDAQVGYASDSSWLFGSQTAAEPQAPSTDELIAALAQVKYFDRATAVTDAADSDVRSTLMSLDDASARTFVLLLNDYAHSSEAL